jgi:hypothetical protein
MQTEKMIQTEELLETPIEITGSEAVMKAL